MYTYIINGCMCIQNLVKVCLSLLQLTKLSIKYGMDGWIDKWMDGKMDGWMDGWMEVQIQISWIHIIFYTACLFVCFDSLHASKQFFSHVRMGLPGLNQYLKAAESCSRTQHRNFASSEASTSNPSIHNLTFYQPLHSTSKIVSVYDQEIPQSQTAYKPMAPRGRATQPSRETRKTD